MLFVDRDELLFCPQNIPLSKKNKDNKVISSLKIQQDYQHDYINEMIFLGINSKIIST